MMHGHPPEQARAYDMRDLELMAIVTDVFDEQPLPGGHYG